MKTINENTIQFEYQFSEDDTKPYVFTVQIPDDYKHLIKNEQFLKETEALLLHFISVVPFYSNNQTGPLGEVSDLRQQLYDLTVQIINAEIAKSISPVPDPKTFLNNSLATGKLNE